MSKFGRIGRVAQRASLVAARGLADWLWPPHCAACQVPLSGPGSRGGLLCEACEATVMVGTEHCCPVCGLVWLDAPPDDGVGLCGPCLQTPPRFARARGAFGYGGAMQEVIQRWKNGGAEVLGPRLGAALGEELEATGASTWASGTVIVPVPSPFRRVVSRGFNPAGVLASAVARRTGLPLELGLRLKRKVPKARGMSRRDRRRRVAGVFAARPGVVRDRPVVLVDDVMTTGATADAAALALRRAGARYVEVVVLARVAW